MSEDSLPEKKLRPFKPLPAEKSCGLCGEVKPADKFYASKYITMTGRRSVQLSWDCRDCHNIGAREKYVKANPRPEDHVDESNRVIVRKAKPIPSEQNCKVCGQLKSISEFHTLKYTTRAGNAKERPCLTCRSCANTKKLIKKYPDMADQLIASRVAGLRGKIYARVKVKGLKELPEEKACRDCGQVKAQCEFVLRRFTTSTGRQSRKLSSACIPCWNRRNLAKGHTRRVYPRGDHKDVYAAMEFALESYRIGDMYWDVYGSCLIEKPTVDHIIPVARDGSNHEDNFVVTSKSNNSSKSDTPLLIWLLKRANRINARRDRKGSILAVEESAVPNVARDGST